MNEKVEPSPEFEKSIRDAEEAVKQQMDSITETDGVLKIGAAEVDLAGAFPLTLGDMRKLEKLGLVTPTGDLKAAGMEGIAKILHYLVSKVNKEIKLDDLDSVSLSKVTRAFLFARKKIQEGEPDLNPTKSSS